MPQASATNYLFSIPNTKEITGTVMGDPPAYRTMRREDVAWLREAACERSALAIGSWWDEDEPTVREEPRFGHFPLAWSNRFTRWTAAREWREGRLETNIVVGWTFVTNAFFAGPGWRDLAAGIDEANPSEVDVFHGLSFGSGNARYLAADTNLYLTGTQTVPYDLPSHTNYVTNVTTNWPEWYWDENYNWINNRTTVVEVLTMPMTNGTASVYTNTWQYRLPRVETRVETNVAAGTVLDLVFAGKEARFWDAPKPDEMRILPRADYVADCYAYLRGMHVLAEAAQNTNWIFRSHRRWRYDYQGERWEVYDVWTSRTSVVGINVTSRQGSNTESARLVFPSRFRRDVLFAGGVSRLVRAELYAVASVIASEDGSAWTQGWWAKALGAAEFVADGATNGPAIFAATVNGKKLAEDAAGAYGLSIPGDWAQFGDYYYLSSIVDFVLVYRLAPWASLPGWNDKGEPPS